MIVNRPPTSTPPKITTTNYVGYTENKNNDRMVGNNHTIQ